VSRILDLKAEGRRFDLGPGHRDLRIRSAIEHPRIVAPAHRTACRTGAFCQDAWRRDLL